MNVLETSKKKCVDTIRSRPLFLLEGTSSIIALFVTVSKIGREGDGGVNATKWDTF